MADTDLSPVKRALIEIRELRARVAELEATAREPLAIVGLAIRVPGGVVDVATFEQLLWNGTDAIADIPADRWDIDAWYDADVQAPGKMTTRLGGFIDGVDRFDAEFFGISPLEAASMDPQQRLALELAWHALEDAGHAPAGLAGTRTGVYLGIANNDYGRALFAQPERIDPYYSSGNAFSVASGRIAYLLGLQGPAVSVDTACSSSLVALHLACQGLRHGDCDIALVGGVNLVLRPEINVNFSKAGMMAGDGRCKTFDAAADGYVRGEGGVMLVVRRLADARADGDRILALVRGTAVNQDGRSNGLTAPNGPAQEAVIRAALEAAGVVAGDVGYVEAHGTGTPLGDPIEVNALGAVLGDGREANRPLAIGSVKTNIGHLEAAAGLAGLAKAVLVLRKGEIPPHLHLQQLNPYIDWASLALAVPTQTTPWPAGAPRIAGISSFGFSGTNAHVLIEAGPPDEKEEAASDTTAGRSRPPQLLPLSARDPAALQSLVGAYRLRLADCDEATLPDLCFTAGAGRTHQPLRLAAQGDDAAALEAALAAWQRGEPHPALTEGRIGAEAPRIAFLFPGQGPQYVGMGRELYEAAPAFREAFDRCCDALDALLPQPLRPIVFGEPGTAGLLDETQYAQPAMFAIEVALATLWRSWGVEPVAVMGHSFGEYAAACVAGAISIADGARMVAARGRLAQGLPRDGAMMVVEADEAAVAAAIGRQGGRVAIAAVNGAANTVISGERSAVEAIAQGFAAGGARTKPLRVSHAFHSPLMDPVLDAFESALEGVVYAEPELALISNLSGRLANRASIGSAAYWRRHLREPVRFADSIHALAAQGITHYIEMSPHPVLLGMGSELLGTGQWLPSLREGRGAWPTLFDGLQALYCSGADIDWAQLHRGRRARRVPAPGYPFQRKRHWIDAESATPAGGPSAAQRWQQMANALDRQSDRAPIGLDVASYPAKWALLARLTRAHALQTMRQAGLFAAAGERRRLADVRETAGIAAAYQHLLQRWLRGLVADGLLREEGGEFVAVAALPAPALEALWTEVEREFADNAPLLAYVRHCGSLVGDVLRGRESPLETLFPGGSFDLARDLYERSATMRYINQLAAAAFESLGAAVPVGRVLRVMEIGAGTGGTSSSLLPALPADRFRYRFTDVSDAFLAEARRRFAAWPGVEFGLFDLEKPLDEQALAPGSVDVIVAANAVHAVKDLRGALTRLRSLLAPGGVLVLVESTVHFEYFDMTTGLIEGWQHFADDLRGDNPLLAPDLWQSALLAAGFARAGAWPPAGSAAEAMGQHVVVAQVPGDGVAATASADADLTAAAAGQADRQTAAAVPAWRPSFDAAVPAQRLDLLRELVRAQVMQVMRLDTASPPALHDRLMDLGMDSLMAVQLRNGLGRALELPRALPSTLMFDHPTIDAIARHLLERLAPEAVAPAPPASARTAAAPALGAADVADLSDEEIARLLDQRLDNPP
ncbi:MAG: type I polyketide synthase [Piscinibacter sp.]